MHCAAKAALGASRVLTIGALLRFLARAASARFAHVFIALARFWQFASAHRAPRQMSFAAEATQVTLLQCAFFCLCALAFLILAEARSAHIAATFELLCLELIFAACAARLMHCAAKAALGAVLCAARKGRFYARTALLTMPAIFARAPYWRHIGRCLLTHNAAQ